jgi:hypothetical protein
MLINFFKLTIVVSFSLLCSYFFPLHCFNSIFGLLSYLILKVKFSGLFSTIFKYQNIKENNLGISIIFTIYLPLFLSIFMFYLFPPTLFLLLHKNVCEFVGYVISFILSIDFFLFCGF